MLKKEWFSAAEIAAMKLPGLPASNVNVIAVATRRGWRKPEWKDVRWRERQGRGGGIEYHYSLLPQRRGSS